MNGWLKRFLRFVSTVVLIGGVLMAVLAVIMFAVGMFVPDLRSTAAVFPLAAAYVLFWALTVGGVLRLLISIDDRLERLEARN